MQHSCWQHMQRQNVCLEEAVEAGRDGGRMVYATLWWPGSVGFAAACSNKHHGGAEIWGAVQLCCVTGSLCVQLGRDALLRLHACLKHGLKGSCGWRFAALCCVVHGDLKREGEGTVGWWIRDGERDRGPVCGSGRAVSANLAGALCVDCACLLGFVSCDCICDSC
jgi:hypothetical protein